MAELSSYEQKRLDTIAENGRVLFSLGLSGPSGTLAQKKRKEYKAPTCKVRDNSRESRVLRPRLAPVEEDLEEESEDGVDAGPEMMEEDLEDESGAEESGAEESGAEESGAEGVPKLVYLSDWEEVPGAVSDAEKEQEQVDKEEATPGGPKESWLSNETRPSTLREKAREAYVPGSKSVFFENCGLNSAGWKLANNLGSVTFTT